MTGMGMGGQSAVEEKRNKCSQIKLWQPFNKLNIIIGRKKKIVLLAIIICKENELFNCKWWGRGRGRGPRTLRIFFFFYCYALVLLTYWKFDDSDSDSLTFVGIYLQERPRDNFSTLPFKKRSPHPLVGCKNFQMVFFLRFFFSLYLCWKLYRNLIILNESLIKNALRTNFT